MSLCRSLPALLVASGGVLGSAGTSKPDLPLLTGHIDFPPGVTLGRSSRFGEDGSAVDLTINEGSVDASVLDLDGDAYLIVSKGEAFCKIDVGCDAASPGLLVEVYEQQGLDCRVLSSTGGAEEGSGGGEHYELRMSADETPGHAADCDSSTDSACHSRWHSASDFEPEWTAHIEFPEGVVLRRAQRGGDVGYGVDRVMSGRTIDASIWDDDGDAFFKVSRGDAFCEVQIGSNGLGPGLAVEVYEQQGLDCRVLSSSGGPKSYTLSMSADDTQSHSVDCLSLSPGSEVLPGSRKLPCRSAWEAPSTVMV